MHIIFSDFFGRTRLINNVEASVGRPIIRPVKFGLMYRLSIVIGIVEAPQVFFQFCELIHTFLHFFVIQWVEVCIIFFGTLVDRNFPRLVLLFQELIPFENPCLPFDIILVVKKRGFFMFFDRESYFEMALVSF